MNEDGLGPTVAGGAVGFPFSRAALDGECAGVRAEREMPLELAWHEEQRSEQIRITPCLGAIFWRLDSAETEYGPFHLCTDPCARPVFRQETL